MSNATTKAVTQPLFKLATRTPFNIAPERGQELAAEIFGSGKWEIRPSETAANFYAIPSERTIYLSYAGLASLWCVAHAAFQVMDIASRAQRAPKVSGQTDNPQCFTTTFNAVGTFWEYNQELSR